jgi:putative endonuclease
MVSQGSVNPSKQLFGQEGERIAERFLKKKGYTIVERNFRCPLGEIDLIALHRRVIVFVEVKRRSGVGFGAPVEAVSWWKQKKMIQAATFFLHQKRLDNRAARFDVVGICRKGPNLVVEHIENAFELS